GFANPPSCADAANNGAIRKIVESPDLKGSHSKHCFKLGAGSQVLSTGRDSRCLDLMLSAFPDRSKSRGDVTPSLSFIGISPTSVEHFSKSDQLIRCRWRSKLKVNWKVGKFALA